MADKKQRPGGARKDEVVTREYTINLHKRLHGWYGCRLLRASRLSPIHLIFLVLAVNKSVLSCSWR